MDLMNRKEATEASYWYGLPMMESEGLSVLVDYDVDGFTPRLRKR